MTHRTTTPAQTRHAIREAFAAAGATRVNSNTLEINGHRVSISSSGAIHTLRVRRDGQYVDMMHVHPWDGQDRTIEEQIAFAVDYVSSL